VELVHLSGEVIVGPHPVLARELAQADRVVLRDPLPLCGRDVDERPAAPEDERRVGAPRRAKLSLREPAIRTTSGETPSPRRRYGREVSRPPVAVRARGESRPLDLQPVEHVSGRTCRRGSARGSARSTQRSRRALPPVTSVAPIRAGVAPR